MHIQGVQPSFECGSLDVRPSYIRPLDIKPLDIRPLDINPSDIRPSDIRPSDIRPSDIRLSDIIQFPQKNPRNFSLQLGKAGKFKFPPQKSAKLFVPAS